MPRLLAWCLLGCMLNGCDGPEPVEPASDPLLARYVAFGNSITAGFESGGINDSTQRQSFAALVAGQMDVTFDLTLLARPGCPPPLTNIFTGATVGDPAAPLCSSLSTPAPVGVHNVAVPGARVVDIFSNNAPGGGTNQLTALLLGGSTQLQAARVSQPTFITVWIGNNEVLSAALTGTAAAATPAAVFAERYGDMVDSLETLAVQGALLIGVVNVSRIPALSPGAAWFLAAAQGALPPTFAVDPNCAPAAGGGVGDAVLVPFLYGFGELFARAASGASVTLDCVEDAPVLTGGEVTHLSGLVEAYNAVIAGEAAARGWAYLDPNPVLDSLHAAGEIPLFPAAPPNPDAETAPFGPWLSRDGVHPSARAHRLIAHHVIDAINRQYDTAIPAPP
jgi:lysophospholipase L1-like esterase